MTTNQQLARIFQQMAAALELLGANPFRVNAHTRVARLLKDLTDDVAAVVNEDPKTAVKRLSALQGVGKGSAEKIIEFVATGAVAEHRKLLDEVPSGLFEVLEIPGVGPKAAKLMWDELGITSVDELKAQLDNPALAALPRLGAKKIENVRKAIAFREKAGERIPIGLALPIAEGLAAALRQVPGARRVDYAGSLRRGRETIGDLDFLAVSDDPEALRQRFTTLPQVTEVLARGETKCSVRLEVDGVALQADLRIIPAEAWGAALMYFTGSKDHNVRMREAAIRQGKRLNEYGLFASTEERPQDGGTTPLAAASEEEIFAALDLPFIPPELREDRGELAGAPPQLIELADVRAELHAHTEASDGRISIAELARCAKARGFHTVAVTDHSQSSAIANGLNADQLLRHVDAVREADQKIRGIKILAGSEVDVLGDGRLDYDDEVLAQLDLVLASPHAGLRQSPRAATERLLRAIRHPLVHILAHPTGRILQQREGLSPDMNALFAAAAECDTALELNANWQRLDLRDTHLRRALEHGCRIAINTDAHEEAHLDFLIYGILTARRAGLEPASCINTWSARRLHAWLAAKR